MLCNIGFQNREIYLININQAAGVDLDVDYTEDSDDIDETQLLDELTEERFNALENSISIIPQNGYLDKYLEAYRTIFSYFLQYYRIE
ncbi:hypothetical protein INT47_010130 [Mucor saturninus]|uniref:Uncharacterized protein n=1 Tax=Mucor saturninus TaxID=64648 RepID=A0A8H7QF56_9FUNG|nr:hypothetical protein INT47_010130 [Mucor saturninus]